MHCPLCTRRRGALRSEHSARATRPALISIEASLLDHAFGCSTLCAALRRDGMVIIDNSDTQMEERRHRCLQAAERFFALPCAAKRKHAASDGPGCQVGYMVIEELGAEMFEAKRHHDPRWPWPDEQTRDDIVGYRENLHAIARTCLRALAQPTCALGLRPGYLESLLDQDRSDGTSTDLTTCSNTTMRIWRYLPDGVGNEVHCDNTLLTVAPPGTCIGLGARRVEDGRWLWPEQLMKPGQVCAPLLIRSA